ncbi:hypothetical protein EDC04DRAFT_2620451, partial [Pisolithus marmoratus]
MKTRTRQAFIAISKEDAAFISNLLTIRWRVSARTTSALLTLQMRCFLNPVWTVSHGTLPETPNLPQTRQTHNIMTSLSTSDDEDDPFLSTVGVDLADNTHFPQKAPLFLKASALSAASLPTVQADDPGDSSNHTSQDADYSSWFESSKTTPFSGFKAATTALQIREQGSRGASAAAVSEGFLVPSSSAFLKAKQKLKLWQEEDEATISTSQPGDSGECASSVVPPQTTTCTPASSKALSFHMPETPMSTAHDIVAGLPQFANTKNPRQFKSPLVGATTNSPLQNSTIVNIDMPVSSACLPFVPPSQLLSSTPRAEPLQRPLGFTTANGRSTPKPRFVTPFKNGIRPTSWNSTPSRAPAAIRFGTISSSIYPPLTTRKERDDKPVTKNAVSAR